HLDHLVDEVACVASQLLGALGDVDGVLVGAGQEAGLVALHSMPAGDHVGPDHLVQGVQAGLVVGIGDGGGQVVTRTVGHSVLGREGSTGIVGGQRAEAARVEIGGRSPPVLVRPARDATAGASPS